MKNISIMQILIAGFLLFNAFLFSQIVKNDLNVISIRADNSISDFEDNSQIILSPRLIELELRYRLQQRDASKIEVEEYKRKYLEALEQKPTWPYLLSGVAQTNAILEKFDWDNIDQLMKNGPNEIKVIKSLSDIVFSNWQKFTKKNQQLFLSFISNKSSGNINSSIKLAARQGLVFEICDYLFDELNEEFYECKRNYWTPLIQQE